jgi:hypothetical protein
MQAGELRIVPLQQGCPREATRTQSQPRDRFAEIVPDFDGGGGDRLNPTVGL